MAAPSRNLVASWGKHLPSSGMSSGWLFVPGAGNPPPYIDGYGISAPQNTSLHSCVFATLKLGSPEIFDQKRGAMLFRRLLKQAKTGLYNDGRGGWTPNDAEARVYATMAELIKAARDLQSEDLVAVMKFPDARMDVLTPLPLLKDLPPPGFPGTTAPGIIISLVPFAVEAANHLKHSLN